MLFACLSYFVGKKSNRYFNRYRYNFQCFLIKYLHNIFMWNHLILRFPSSTVDMQLPWRDKPQLLKASPGLMTTAKGIPAIETTISDFIWAEIVATERPSKIRGWRAFSVTKLEGPPVPCLPASLSLWEPCEHQCDTQMRGATSWKRNVTIAGMSMTVAGFRRFGLLPKRKRLLPFSSLSFSAF